MLLTGPPEAAGQTEEEDGMRLGLGECKDKVGGALQQRLVPPLVPNACCTLFPQLGSSLKGSRTRTGRLVNHSAGKVGLCSGERARTPGMQTPESARYARMKTTPSGGVRTCPVAGACRIRCACMPVRFALAISGFPDRAAHSVRDEYINCTPRLSRLCTTVQNDVN